MISRFLSRQLRHLLGYSSGGSSPNKKANKRVTLVLTALMLTLLLLFVTQEPTLVEEIPVSCLEANPVLKQPGLPGFYQDTDYCTVYSYHNDNISLRIGEPLILLNRYKERFNWPPTNYVTNTQETDISFGHVFVTGTSENHYEESRRMVASVQIFSPGVKLIFYDLGLKSSQVEEVQSLCGVEYRKFNFSAYPPHVRYLKNYAFKPIIMAEGLKEYPRIVWIDSSIRFLSSGNFSHIKPQLIRNGGMIQLLSNGHSIYMATHPKLYTYFPGNMDKIKETEMGGAGFLYITRTEYIFKNVFMFYVLCALDVNCIQPTKNLKCKEGWWWKEVKSTDYRDCHRFDQSTIGLLLANHYNYDGSLYRDNAIRDGEEAAVFARVSREDIEGDVQLKTCG